MSYLRSVVALLVVAPVAIACSTVADEGPGIPQESHEKVFEPFYRGLSGTPGVGLGLAISRAIARQMAASGSPYTVTVRATDTGGLFTEQSFTYTVNALPPAIFGDGFEG